MEFEQQAQQRLHGRVSSYLNDAFGEFAEPISDEPAFTVHLGRVHITVVVNANGPHMASVLAFTPVATGLRITLELATLLLEKNHIAPFGILGLRNGEIWLHHVLFGETLNNDTLAMLLRILADYAEGTQDELNLRFR